MSAPALLLVFLGIFPSTEDRVDLGFCDLVNVCWESGAIDWPEEQQ